MEVDSVGSIPILSMSYITTRVVKILRVPVENRITTLSMVKFPWYSLRVCTMPTHKNLLYKPFHGGTTLNITRKILYPVSTDGTFSLKVLWSIRCSHHLFHVQIEDSFCAANWTIGKKCFCTCFFFLNSWRALPRVVWRFV